MVPGNPACAKCGHISGVEGKPRAVAIWALLFGVIGVPGGCCGGLMLIGANSATGSTPIIVGIVCIAISLALLVTLIRNRNK
jgi:hypothetical protein